MAMVSVSHVWDAEAFLTPYSMIQKQESQSIMEDSIRVL